MKYQVKFNSGKVHSSHDTIAAAGRAMREHNTANRQFALTVGLVGVHHVPEPGMPHLGDVTALAERELNKRAKPKLPRRTQRRKHGTGDAVDELTRTILKDQRKRRR